MKYDIIVIGGGPAGMMAAGRAGELGARVLLLEKNSSLGIKLMMTGKGRCNITNYQDDLKAMILEYGEKGKFLFSSLYNFGPTEVVDFFHQKNVETKIEDNNRVFPKSDSSKMVLDAIASYLIKNNVEIKYKSVVKAIILKKNSKEIEKLRLENGEECKAENFIIATGGKSYPSTGSSGDAYGWLDQLGHKVINPSPALTPIVCKDSFVGLLEGRSLRNVKIDLQENGKKICSEQGDAIFTKDGMSGPCILNLTRHFAQKKNSTYILQIDLLIDKDKKEIDEELIEFFKINANKQIKNILAKYLPNKMILVFLEIIGVDPEKKANLITAHERKSIINKLKIFSLEVKNMEGFEKAMITKGGVDVREVDPKNMQSRIVPNLFFAGEVLDLDGPSGGFNLQICWSTGFSAGEGAFYSCEKRNEK